MLLRPRLDLRSGRPSTGMLVARTVRRRQGCFAAAAPSRPKPRDSGSTPVEALGPMLAVAVLRMSSPWGREALRPWPSST